MRIFVVGASGAIGSRLVPQLLDGGHEVIGTSRSPGNGERVRALGAEPIGVHMPDPIVDRADGTDPEHEALLADSVGLALLVVLETKKGVRYPYWCGVSDHAQEGMRGSFVAR